MLAPASMQYPTNPELLSEMLPVTTGRQASGRVLKPRPRGSNGNGVGKGSVGFVLCDLLFRWRRHAFVALVMAAILVTLWMQSAMLPARDAAAAGSIDVAEEEFPGGGATTRLDKLRAQPSESTQIAEKKIRQEERRLAVKAAMQHAWGNYEKYAFGADEVGPVSAERKDDVWGDIACSLVDGMDTLWIMDMKDEFKRARDYVAAHLRFDHLGTKGTLSIFETIIREVGGLLSAFDLSGDEIFKTKAVELMELLLPAFEPSEDVFYTYFNPKTLEKNFSPWTSGNALIADIGTLQLEMRYLSDITGDPKYSKRGDAFYSILKREGSYKDTGLFPVHYDTKLGSFAEYSSISIGAYGDSFYEYLIKVYIYSGKRPEDEFLRTLYDDAVRGMAEKMLKYSKADNLSYLQTLRVPGLSGEDNMDHLLCFVPGMLALGTLHEHTDTEKNKRHMELAETLMETCYQMYHRHATGLSPDVVEFPFMLSRDPKYKLRPEAVESLFYMYRITKDEKYREFGWEIFQSLEKYAKVEHGYGAVMDVRHNDTTVEDKMESFFLAETLKYHYLLQAPDDLIPLDEYVFNTEAHPVRIRR